MSGPAEAEITTASLDDADALADLWVALARGQRAYGSYLCAEENRAAIRETMVRRIVGDELYVAEREGSIVGFVTFTVEQGRYAQTATTGVVENLYVEPEFRDRGIGSALLATAEERLGEAGATVITIEAMADNDAARAFYARHGYTPHRVELQKPTETDTT